MILLIRKMFKVIMALLSVFIGAYFIFIAMILLWPVPSDSHDQKYDGLIVLTGANGRIEKGFTLLDAKTAPRMLISGVQNEIDFNSLVKANSENLTPDQKESIINHCCISLDYIADTTQTNAIESAKWVYNYDLKKILIITSAVHMPRAYIQYRTYISNDVHIDAYPYYRLNKFELICDKKFWYNSIKEYFKFYGSLIQIAKQ